VRDWRAWLGHVSIGRVGGCGGRVTPECDTTVCQPALVLAGTTSIEYHSHRKKSGLNWLQDVFFYSSQKRWCEAHCHWP